MFRTFLTSSLLAVICLAQTSPPSTGSVQGTVLDGEGKPLAEATVFVGTHTNAPSTKTDAEGNFMLSGVPAGNVGLNAYKESDGYPYNMFSFYLTPGEQLPKFDLAAGQTVKGVIVHLGPKAAYLKFDITDEDGKPVGAGASFSRPDLGQFGDYQTSIPANRVVLVPPVPFRLTIAAKGYEPWHYGGERWRGREGLIALKSGETLNLAIQLKKAE